jgi:hypothetical protein
MFCEDRRQLHRKFKMIVDSAPYRRPELINHLGISKSRFSHVYHDGASVPVLLLYVNELGAYLSLYPLPEKNSRAYKKLCSGCSDES